MRARPHAFVAQEQVAALDRAGVATAISVEPRHDRAAHATVVASGDGYAVMPGGLTRVASSRRFARRLDAARRRQQGHLGAVARGPVSPFTLLRPAGAPVELTRGGGELPSRVADNLFWLGRYVERAEGTARLLRGILARLADGGSGERARAADAAPTRSRR